MKKFIVSYTYRSQWYDQCDDNYVPESYDGTFEVYAEDMEGAKVAADAVIRQKNEESLWGEDEAARERNRSFPTHKINSISAS